MKPIGSALFVCFLILSPVAFGQTNHRDSLYHDAIDLAYQENFDGALKLLRAIVSENPNDTVAVFECGMMCAHLSRHEEAIDYFSRYIQLEPSEVDGYFLRGISRMELNMDKQALRDFKKTLKLESKNADAAYFSAMILKAAGKTKQALKYIDHALDVAPSEKRYQELRVSLL